MTNTMFYERNVLRWKPCSSTSAVKTIHFSSEDISVLVMVGTPVYHIKVTLPLQKCKYCMHCLLCGFKGWSIGFRDSPSPWAGIQAPLPTSWQGPQFRFPLPNDKGKPRLMGCTCTLYARSMYSIMTEHTRSEITGTSLIAAVYPEPYFFGALSTTFHLQGNFKWAVIWRQGLWCDVQGSRQKKKRRVHSMLT